MTKEIINPGIHVISNETYHASAGISRSGLWTFKQLPHKYWYEYLSGEYQRPVDKEAFVVGDLTHTLLLEPDLYEHRYYMKPKLEPMPPAVLLKDVGKEQFEQVKQARRDVKERNDALMADLGDVKDKKLITLDQFELARGMVDSMKQHKVVNDVLTGDIKVEHSIFWQDQETGILCKARPDLWNSPLVADLKTTADAGYRGFQMSAMKYGYFLQAGMIYEALKSVGIPFDKFLFMCVESKKPHSVGLYLLDDEALQFGIDLFHQLLRQYAECLNKNEWPDYGIKMLMIPRYATLEMDNE